VRRPRRKARPRPALMKPTPSRLLCGRRRARGELLEVSRCGDREL
jgi:hypothetical protein